MGHFASAASVTRGALQGSATASGVYRHVARTGIETISRRVISKLRVPKFLQVSKKIEI